MCTGKGSRTGQREKLDGNTVGTSAIPPGSPGQSTALRLVVWDFIPLYHLSLWLGSPWGGDIIWTKQLFSARGSRQRENQWEATRMLGRWARNASIHQGDLRDTIPESTTGHVALSVWGSLGRESVAGCITGEGAGVGGMILRGRH